MIFASIVGVIVLLMLIGFQVNKASLKKENNTLKPKGKLVEVDGGQINVYTEGNGKETVVILSGYGVALPQAEYGPLLRNLQDDYKVVICDYKGLGFSSVTDKPRTVEQMVEETREALKGAGITPPYILMPHSIGGAYSEYYAIKYPEEVKAMIQLDGTPTVMIGKKAPNMVWVFKLSKFLQNVGFTRFQLSLIRLPYPQNNGYTEEEIKLLTTFTKRCFNDTMINQGSMIATVIEEMSKMEMPSGIPVLKLISKQSVAMTSKQLKLDAMIYQEQHLEKLGNAVSHELLDCGHNMHQTNAHEVAEKAKVFISAL